MAGVMPMGIDSYSRQRSTSPSYGYNHQSHYQAPLPRSQTPGAARFEIVKPSFSDRYECRLGEATEGPLTYSLNVSKSSLEMMAGNRPVAAVYLPKAGRSSFSKSKTFRLGLGDPSSVRWTEMTYNGKDKYGWSFPFTIPQTGQTIPLTWHKSNDIAVDGLRASRLSGSCFNLRDPQGQIMAVFTSHSWGLSSRAVGALQINMNLGPSFEHIVVITLVGIYEQQKRDSDKKSGNNAAITAGVTAGIN